LHAISKPLNVASGSEQWSVSFGELHGTRTEVWSGRFFRSDEQLGPFHTAYGRDSRGAWHQNENGEVVREAGFHLRDAIDERALDLATGSGVTMLGTVASPTPAYVLKVNPPNGRLEYLFYDRTTYRLIRRDAIRDGRRVSTTFGDYRITGGFAVPFRIHSEDGKPDNVRDDTLTTMDFGESIPDARLAAPTPAPAIATIAGGQHAVIPATIADDRVILTFQIDGHPVDMQLDSGASGIVINNAVIKALGFKQYGRMTGSTAGDYTESGVIIPEMKLGSVTIANAYAQSLPFAEVTDKGTPVAGLLGFDVLDQLVVHIDYMNGTVEAWEPTAFEPPAGAVAIPIALDDDVPALSISLAGTSLRMILDTGADRSVLFSAAMHDHPTQFPELGLGELMQSQWPFVNDLSGVGGTVEYRPLQTGPMQVGQWTFDRWLFDVTQNDPTFEFEDYDGLLGQEFLRNFNLYLDLPQQRIFLIPNQRYHDRWG
ncbi:MAG TPA: pepsin/retropepsin-like aspartic protease family protein, partial [Candidatus Baltobacteraceae bacterium]|nr:pepsin/retropepsin-like aspartic protease family protein [Candidatus Baltobacteraceae bacterium]